MDQRLMKAMLDLDEHHWWYRGRRMIVRTQIEHLSLPDELQILDAGCGSGRTLEDLADYGTVAGLELDPEAAAVAASRGCGEIKVGRLEELPWDPGAFDLITCLDVLEHLPDDRGALAELRRVCRPGGWLLLTVPAYQGLWSLHDAANHHYRRYSRRRLRLVAAESGWRLRRMSSFNSILLPLAAAVRLAQRQRKPDSSYVPELKLGPKWLNSALERPLRAEARWLDRGGTLPAGLSLLALLENPGPGADGGAPQH